MPEASYDHELRYVSAVDLGCARVSTAKQDLDRQIDALTGAGVAPERIYVDKKSGATVDRLTSGKSPNFFAELPQDLLGTDSSLVPFADTAQ